MTPMQFGSELIEASSMFSYRFSAPGYAECCFGRFHERTVQLVPNYDYMADRFEGVLLRLLERKQ